MHERDIRHPLVKYQILKQLPTFNCIINKNKLNQQKAQIIGNMYYVMKLWKFIDII